MDVEKLKKLKIVHFAIGVMQLVFCLGVYFVFKMEEETLNADNSPFLIVGPILVVGALFASNFLFKFKLNQINASENQDKMSAYTVASILRFALVEAATVFCIVFYILTGSIYLLALAFPVIIYFFTLAPSENKVKRDLGMNEGSNGSGYLRS